MDRAIQTIKKTLRKYREDDCDPYLAMLTLLITKNRSGTSASELLMKRKLETLVPSVNVNVNTKTKLNKSTVSQSWELQPLNTSDTIRYRQNNDLPQSYTLLNDKDNVIPRNRSHLIKMDSNFVKIENDDDIDNDIRTEPKTRHSTSATTPEELDEPRVYAAELGQTLSHTTRSGRRAIKASRYGEHRKYLL